MEQGSFGSDELLIVQALMRATEPTSSAVSAARSWLTVTDAKRVLAAVDRYDKRVFLADTARLFVIQYHGTKVWLAPVDPTFTPCGWFMINDMRRRVAESHALRAISQP
jgi:hypothetical protein